jgi:hypothetical protein
MTDCGHILIFTEAEDALNNSDSSCGLKLNSAEYIDQSKCFCALVCEWP